ncbi:MAG: hypothetical protein WCB51_01150 [Candidatus Dormiibacterota bacterium]
MGTPRTERRQLTLRRWAPAAAAAIVIGVAGAVFLATRPASRTPFPGAADGGRIPAALRADVLTALDASAGDIVAIHRTSSISDGEALNESIWLSPSEPATGQLVRRRSVILDASGAPVQDVEVTYTMPAGPAQVSGQNVGIDATGAVAPAIRVTGSTIDVDYPSRSWAEEDNASMVVAVPDDLSAVRTEIASGDWTAGAPSTLSGRRAIELTWHESGGTRVTHELWISADTYLPIREIYAHRAGSHGSALLGTIESDYTMLPPSATNRAELSPPVPAGFTNETGPHPSPGG